MLNIEAAILIIFFYFVGAITSGLIVTRIIFGIDVRKYGSGNIGATNVLRTTGKKASIIVLMSDFVKALIPILLARIIFGVPLIEAICAGAVVFGHCWPIYLWFRGGKGVATAFIGFLVLIPIVALIASLAGISVIAITRFVSLGSIIGATVAFISSLVMYFWFSQPIEYTFYTLFVFVVVFIRHKDNIKRLLSGTEAKFGKLRSR